MRHASIILLLVLAGCAADPEAAPDPLVIDPPDYSRVFDATVWVLRDYGFRVDRQDHRHGVVKTRPLGSPTIFEPWKRTNATGQIAEQSTWTELRRTVTVTLEPQRSGDVVQFYAVAVEVDLERQALPLRRLDGSVTRRPLFATLSEVPIEWQRRGIPARYWEPIGRDDALEQRLRGAILDRSIEITE